MDRLSTRLVTNTVFRFLTCLSAILWDSMNETRRVPYQQHCQQIMTTACMLQERPLDAPTANGQCVGGGDLQLKSSSSSSSSASSSSSSSSSTDVSWWFASRDQPFAPSPYMVFCAEQRPKITALNPKATYDEIGHILNDRWSPMDRDAKAHYVEQSGKQTLDDRYLTRGHTRSFPYTFMLTLFSHSGVRESCYCCCCL